MEPAEKQSRHRVLIADDEESFAEETKLLLGTRYEIKVCLQAEGAVDAAGEGWPDVIVLDIEFPGMSGLEAMERIRALDPDLPVIMLTRSDSVPDVVEAMRKGAHNYVCKSAGADMLQEAVESALRYRRQGKSLRYMSDTLEEARGVVGGMVLGSSPVSRRLREEIERAAGVDIGVLVLGDTGTGKSHIAKAIHNNSARSDGPFITFEVPLKADATVTSKLFGHRKGSFTGATADRIGALEAADGGTLFLDEIADLPIEVQAGLLHALQEKTYTRLGEHAGQIRTFDARIIAATNRDLEKLVAEREFRQDLYYRLRVLVIEVPPLRDRLSDIPLLVDEFLKRHHASTGGRVSRISDRALEALATHDWPGNIRELEHVIMAGMVRAESHVLDLDDLVIESGSRPTIRSNVSYALAKDQVVTDFKKRYLTQMLDEVDGIVSQAARRAGLAPQAFRKMMRETGIRPQRDAHTSGDRR